MTWNWPRTLGHKLSREVGSERGFHGSSLDPWLLPELLRPSASWSSKV